VVVDAQTGRVFVPNVGSDQASSTVSVLDTQRGAVLATVPMGQPDHSPVGRQGAVAVDARTGRVFVTNRASYTVNVLDARSGVVLDTVPVGPGPDAVAVDEARGRVVVPTSYDHSVSILDARSGSVLHTVALAQGPSGAGMPLWSMAVAVDGRTGRAFVANSDANSVSVLAVRTGTVLRTIVVGVHPRAMAVDERTGRAFVANSGGTVREPVPWWQHDVQWLRHWLPGLPQPVSVVRTELGSVSVIDASRV
jgi:YVTN family beta-propeller protein